VHILREDRGATLEVVISRMKTRGDHIRFIAVSASVRINIPDSNSTADVDQVPNVDDVARWLGRVQPPAANLGIYEGGGETGDGTDESAEEKPILSYNDMPQAKVFRVRRLFI
jgi:hypothetical protein